MKIARVERQSRPATSEDLRESLRPHNMDMADPKVMKTVFWDGHTTGVFQFTGKGITRLAQRVKSETFDDVSAVVSLYRPGPLASGMHNIFLKNKTAPDEVVYEHPIFEKLLKRTRGALIYQEQLMKMCQLVGKMELKDVQRIRKNLLKKIKGRTVEFLRKENEELSAKFITGFVENGFTEEKAKQWWLDTLAWGSYGFNASHSYTYSVMTMQCAHLATYHPLEFYSAVLTKGQSDELQDYVSGIQKRGIKVLPVDVNRSRAAHVIERLDDGKEGIRLSLSSVLGVGASAVEKIVSGQPYADLDDFLVRSKCSKTAVQPLILVGALSAFSTNVRDLETKYESYCVNPKWRTKKCRDQWLACLGQPPVHDYPPHERVFFENQLMGFSLRGSPFEILDREKKLAQICGEDAVPYKELVEALEPGETTAFPVLVKELKEKADRKMQMMAWVKFQVQSGEEFEVPVFSSVWKHVRSSVRKGSVYVGTFNKPEGAEDEMAVLLGRPGWAHSARSCAEYLIDVDTLELEKEGEMT